MSLTIKMFVIVFLLICIFSWLPIIAIAFYRYTIKKRAYTIGQQSVNSFLMIIGSAVYLLPLYAWIDGARVFRTFRWGYWLLLVSITILCICYLNVQKKQSIDLDLSKHLIDND